MPIVTAVWRYLIASLVAGAGAFAITTRAIVLQELSGSIGAATRMVLVSLIFATLYLAGVIVLHGGITPIQQVIRLIGEMAPWRKSSNPRTSLLVTPNATASEAISS
jgi:hypothetical protein